MQIETKRSVSEDYQRLRCEFEIGMPSWGAKEDLLCDPVTLAAIENLFLALFGQFAKNDITQDKIDTLYFEVRHAISAWEEAWEGKDNAGKRTQERHGQKAEAQTD